MFRTVEPGRLRVCVRRLQPSSRQPDRALGGERRPAAGRRETGCRSQPGRGFLGADSRTAARSGERLRQTRTFRQGRAVSRAARLVTHKSAWAGTPRSYARAAGEHPDNGKHSPPSRRRGQSQRRAAAARSRGRSLRSGVRRHSGGSDFRPAGDPGSRCRRRRGGAGASSRRRRRVRIFYRFPRRRKPEGRPASGRRLRCTPGFRRGHGCEHRSAPGSRRPVPAAALARLLRTTRRGSGAFTANRRLCPAAAGFRREGRAVAADRDRSAARRLAGRGPNRRRSLSRSSE